MLKGFLNFKLSGIARTARYDISSYKMWGAEISKFTHQIKAPRYKSRDSKPSVAIASLYDKIYMLVLHIATAGCSL